MNRGQQAAVDMKSDLTAYEFVPEMISSLSPAPRYPTPALGLSKAQQKGNRDARYNLERHRSSYITKKQNEAKFVTGRLHSHYKLE